MAKHPVPNQKVPKWRKRRRRTAWEKQAQRKLLDMTKLVVSQESGEMKKAHFVCPVTGKYRGRQVVSMDKAISKPIEKIKV